MFDGATAIFSLFDHKNSILYKISYLTTGMHKIFLKIVLLPQDSIQPFYDSLPWF